MRRWTNYCCCKRHVSFALVRACVIGKAASTIWRVCIEAFASRIATVEAVSCITVDGCIELSCCFTLVVRSVVAVTASTCWRMGDGALTATGARVKAIATVTVYRRIRRVVDLTLIVSRIVREPGITDGDRG